MKKLSEIALEQSAPIIQSIIHHPFNQELASGALDKNKFSYYIEQDTIYLRDFSRSLSMLAAKVPAKYIEDFLIFSKGALIAEQEVVHVFFKKIFALQETQKITPATLSYTSYLLRTTSLDAVEVGIAAILPCFWIYQMVGLSIVKNIDTTSPHPYKQWIETYAGDDFQKTVQRAIVIFDEMAQSCSDHIRHLMLEAFYNSAVLEWHFWNDAYNQTVFDACLLGHRHAGK